jgi:hypothetical protein
MPVSSYIVSSEGNSFRRRLFADYILAMGITEISILRI